MDRMDRIRKKMMNDERGVMNEEGAVFHSSFITPRSSFPSSCSSCPSMSIVALARRRAGTSPAPTALMNALRRGMKGTLALLLCLALTSPVVHAQKAGEAARFFPAQDLMRIGVYYYPEHWPESQWERDFANMERLGFEFVHMAEFAWAQMGPEEGKFDFAWLDRAVGLAARHHLRVILCTPTPCPPAWMAEKYPEIFLVGEDGRRREHGSRGNNALADPTYLRLTERVVTELARRYGRNPAVWGWQLDNEPPAQPDYSPSAQAAFRDWLRARYKTIDVLNREWGAAFWSLKYNSFAQIKAPNPTLLYGPSPHAMLDFRRFTADQTAHFLNWKAAI